MDRLSLLSALESDATNLFAQDQLRRIDAILVEKAPIGGVIAQILSLTPKYDYVNPNITDSNFPVTTEPNLDGARLDKITGSRTQILAALKRDGRRAATAAELLLYGIKNPEEQRKYWIWALAQVWLAPGSRYECAVVLLVRGGGKRRADLSDVADDVDAVERVLSFPL